jgi:hypothetical protein
VRETIKRFASNLADHNAVDLEQQLHLLNRNLQGGSDLGDAAKQWLRSEHFEPFHGDRSPFQPLGNRLDAVIETGRACHSGVLENLAAIAASANTGGETLRLFRLSLSYFSRMATSRSMSANIASYSPTARPLVGDSSLLSSQTGTRAHGVHFHARFHRSLTFRVDAGLTYQHDGQYAKFSHFQYSGEGEV